nr:transposase (putative), gypsy type [Tanacetum cinerariifolium]
MTPRSCLRWKPTGKIFKTVGLRWVPTGKIFTSSTTKVDSDPLNGSNADITNQYECEQTHDVSAGTSNPSAGASFNPKEEGLRVYSELGFHDHGNEPSSSKMVPNVVPPADKTATTRQALELIFHHHITMLRILTKIELSLEQSQQGASNDVLWWMEVVRWCRQWVGDVMEMVMVGPTRGEGGGGRLWGWRWDGVGGRMGWPEKLAGEGGAPKKFYREFTTVQDAQAKCIEDHAAKLAIEEGIRQRLEAGIVHGKAARDLKDAKSYDVDARQKHIAAVHDLEDVPFPLLDLLEACKDSIIEFLMSSLTLRGVMAVAASLERAAEKRKKDASLGAVAGVADASQPSYLAPSIELPVAETVATTNAMLAKSTALEAKNIVLVQAAYPTRPVPELVNDSSARALVISQ